jgi:hypothetical protein
VKHNAECWRRSRKRRTSRRRNYQKCSFSRRWVKSSDRFGIIQRAKTHIHVSQLNKQEVPPLSQISSQWPNTKHFQFKNIGTRFVMNWMTLLLITWEGRILYSIIKLISGLIRMLLLVLH